MIPVGYPKTFDGSVNYDIADFVYEDSGKEIDTYLVCISVDDYPPTLEILEVDIDGNMIWENDWWEGEKKITLWYYVTLRNLNRILLSLLYNLPSAQLDIKPICYRDCSNAMMKMWMDNVVTDGEYNRIMDKLNAYWRKCNEI